MALQRNDILWKGIIEDFFAELLMFFFKDADKLIDFGKGFTFLDKDLEELVPDQQVKHPKVVDKLVRVVMRSGKEEWLLVHLEVQGYSQKDFPLRMFTYYYRILDKYHRPVTCIAIFLGKRRSWNESFFAQELLETKLRFEYNSYYIGEQNEEELKKIDNPFAIVVRTALLKWKHHRNTAQLFAAKIGLARNLLRSGLPREKTRRLFDFLNYYLHFEDQKLNSTFDRQLKLLTNTKTATTMGITEQILDIAEKRGEGRGLKEGLQKGKKEGLQQGKKEGLQKGKREGEQKGLQKGLQQGKKEGEREKALSVAKQLKALGVSNEIIRKSTGLSSRSIKAL